jgi:hypothetical protein
MLIENSFRFPFEWGNVKREFFSSVRPEENRLFRRWGHLVCVSPASGARSSLLLF